MKLFPEGRSFVVSAAAMTVTAAAAYMTCRSLSELVDFLYFYRSASFYPALAHSKLPMGMPPLAALLARHMVLSFYFSFFFWLSAAVLAAGVWRRREWARRGAVAMCYVISAAAAMLLLFPWLVVPEPFVYGGVSLAPEFNAMVRSAAFLVRLAAFTGGGLCLWWALALDRGAARKEFPAGSK